MCMHVARGLMLMQLNDSLSALFFEAGSLSQTQISLIRLVSLVSLSQRSLVSVFRGWNYLQQPCPSSTHVIWGIQTQGFLFAWQGFKLFFLESSLLLCQVCCWSDLKLTFIQLPANNVSTPLPLGFLKKWSVAVQLPRARVPGAVLFPSQRRETLSHQCLWWSQQDSALGAHSSKCPGKALSRFHLMLSRITCQINCMLLEAQTFFCHHSHGAVASKPMAKFLEIVLWPS